MSKPVFSCEAFLDFCKSKDPAEEFCPSSGLTCALAQYGRFLGFENALGGNSEFYEGSESGNTIGRRHQITGLNSSAIYHGQWTGNSDGYARNNFRNLVIALEFHVIASPTF